MSGYVVIEYNQASSQPRVLGDDVWTDLEDARDVAEQAREETRAVGRRERYAVAELTIIEEDQ